jgi:hypothetical protein
MDPWFETLFDECYVTFYEELRDRDVAAGVPSGWQ